MEYDQIIGLVISWNFKENPGSISERIRILCLNSKGCSESETFISYQNKYDATSFAEANSIPITKEQPCVDGAPHSKCSGLLS